MGSRLLPRPLLPLLRYGVLVVLSWGQELADLSTKVLAFDQALVVVLVSLLLLLPQSWVEVELLHGSRLVTPFTKLIIPSSAYARKFKVALGVRTGRYSIVSGCHRCHRRYHYRGNRRGLLFFNTVTFFIVVLAVWYCLVRLLGITFLKDDKCIFLSRLDVVHSVQILTDRISPPGVLFLRSLFGLLVAIDD